MDTFQLTQLLFYLHTSISFLDSALLFFRVQIDESPEACEVTIICQMMTNYEYRSKFRLGVSPYLLSEVL